ncbi:unnamed protein product, partial [marine sediment metagenome]
AFSVSCGLGLVAGHALLGAGWLVLKTTGEMRDWTYSRLTRCLLATLVLLAITQVIKPEAPGLLVLALVAAAFVFFGAKKRIDWIPFAATCAMFVSVFADNLVRYWPFIMPHTITIAEAAAPETSLAFLFYGAGLIAIPVTLAYTCAIFWIFRGKISATAEIDYEQ